MVAFKNPDLALSAQPGNRESHGNAMIMEGLNGATTDLTALNNQTVDEHFGFDAQGVETFCHGADAIAFLHT